MGSPVYKTALIELALVLPFAVTLPMHYFQSYSNMPCFFTFPSVYYD